MRMAHEKPLNGLFERRTVKDRFALGRIKTSGGRFEGFERQKGWEP
jgi:hypothetical protein